MPGRPGVRDLITPVLRGESTVIRICVILAEWVGLCYGFRLNDDSSCRRMILYRAIPVQPGQSLRVPRG